MTKIAIIIVSTRPGRVGHNVAEWVHQIASKRTDRAPQVEMSAWAENNHEKIAAARASYDNHGTARP